MKKIVECVPNFSEGQKQTVIDAIAEAIGSTNGCRLLDVDAGASTNRSVYTFVGTPESVVEGALAAARVARMKIDMRKHQGEHPRFGAMDVCPFIPVRGVSMAECAALAKEFAMRAARELGIPLYLYGEAASQETRKKLANLRQGEYEGLAARLADPGWKPDFGPATFVPEWGITATGARKFLIAYNVNILGTANQAHRIALNLREAGRGKDKPGKLEEVRGIGWYVKEYDMAQVTVNLTDYHITPPHVLFEAVKEEAASLNLAVAGSEIVGVVPEEVMSMAAEYYISRENLFIYQSDQKIRLAIERLGLNSVKPFLPAERVIERIIAEAPAEPLASMSVRGFIEEVAARSAAPGGGSVSAVVSALGVALGAMVGKLTQGVRRFDRVQSQMQEAIPPLHDLTAQLIPMIDADTEAFKEYMEGARMPKETEEQRHQRHEKMQAGLRRAIEVPLTTMRLGNRAWNSLLLVARYGNPASSSDVQVGARSLAAGIWGAHKNVLINLADIEDGDFTREVTAEADELVQRAENKCAEILAIIDSR